MLRTVRQNWIYYLILGVFLVLVILDSFVYQMPRTRIGDVVEHVSALNAWIDSPFNPENPSLKSDVASPRFIPIYLPFVLLGSVFAWDGWVTYYVIALFGALLFIYSVHAFFRSLYQQSYAPLIGWLVFMGLWTDPWNYSSVYAYSTLYKITGYPSILSFSLSLLCLSVLIKSLKKNRLGNGAFAGLGVLTALVITSHILTGVFLLGSAALYILFTNASKSLKTRLFFAGGLGFALSFLWPFYPIWEIIGFGNVTSGASWTSELRFEPDRSSRLSINHAFYEWHRYYLAFLGILAACYLLLKRDVIPFFGIFGFGSLFILNLFIPIPLGHRFVIYSLFFGHLAVFLVVMKFLRSKYEKQTLPLLGMLGLMAVFLVSNIIQITPQFKKYKSHLIERNRIIQMHTSKDSVIAGNPGTMWMVSAYHRKVLWLKHPNPLVKDRHARAMANILLQSPDADLSVRRMMQSCFGVTHLVLFEGTKRNPQEDIIRLMKAFDSQDFKKEKVGNRYWLYELPEVDRLASCGEREIQQMRQAIDQIYPSQ